MTGGRRVLSAIRVSETVPVLRRQAPADSLQTSVEHEGLWRAAIIKDDIEFPAPSERCWKRQRKTKWLMPADSFRMATYVALLMEERAH